MNINEAYFMGRLGCSGFAEMRQSIKPVQLEVLMTIYSKRDLPEATREAVRMRIVHGCTYEWAEMETGVTRKRIAAAVRKLEKAHESIRNVYGI